MSEQHAPLPSDDAGTGLVRAGDVLPRRVLALPLAQRPIFPGGLLNLGVPPGRLTEIARQAIAQHHGWVAFFLVTRELPDLAAFAVEDLAAMGTLARITRHEEVEGGILRILVETQSRFAPTRFSVDGSLVHVVGEPVPAATEGEAADQAVRAAVMAIVTSLKDLVQFNPVFADEIKAVLANYNSFDGPGRLADLAASLTMAGREELQAVLATVPLLPRLERVLALLAQERQVSEVKTKIRAQIDEKVGDNQRRFFLNEQLKAIKKELGIETDPKSLELGKLRDAFAAKRGAMSAEAVQVTEEELRKLELLQPESSEYGVTRNRVEWLIELPWGVSTADNQDLESLRAGLDRDHFGLEDVKERIGEFCAVRALKADHGGGIVCLVGPPGTGKTSIGISIAKQLGRKFYRFSLGGLRDEAEIKGHRRTYVGALPGKLAQALRRCGSMNPVILLDEIDKLGHGLQGDPSSALLEVLDPEQNRDFLDHYLDIRLDLSQVLFICTANDLAGVPEPLRDRMEIIRLAGYVEEEKLHIAAKHLLPRQRREHGLAAGDLAVSNAALRALLRGHAREAGVRHADQLLARICRKVATAKAGAGKRWRKVAVTPANLADYVGKPAIVDEALLDRPRPGVVTGLAWTALGGATLEIEAVAISVEAGKGGFQLSGQLGEVMKESAGLARSWLRAHAARLGIAPAFFDDHVVHLHVPAGAVPKDGPSAGITMATALCSLALGRSVVPRLGMTGELTLTGRVFPIGGVREKTVAARRAGVRTVLLPAANAKDWEELPERLRTGLTVHYVSSIEEVLIHAGLLPGAVASRRSTPMRQAKPR